LTPEPGSAKSVEIVVERKDKQGKASRKTIEVVPEAPLQSPVQMPTNPTSIEPLGVAFQMTNEVAAVDEDGPAGKTGLEAGDILTELQFVSDDQEREKALTRFAGPLIFRPIDLKSGKKSWTEVMYLLQTVYPDMKAKLTWERGEKEMSAELLPRDSTSFFNDTRGVTLYIDTEPHAAASLSEAAYLGYRETRDQLLQVLTILHRLITGRISITNLSGPPGIIAAAASVASQGIAPLLLFLTMLSANLAVLNFLPIPALDGGHMLFLSAEAIRGKPVDERLQIRLTIAGVICLLSLMVFATAMDIQRFSEMFQKWFG
jgi:regulator of sigma E protease